MLVHSDGSIVRLFEMQAEDELQIERERAGVDGSEQLGKQRSELIAQKEQQTHLLTVA